MEDKSSLIPSFARGLNVLLVECDEASLMGLSSMLEQYAFKVTATGLAKDGLSMVEEQNKRFKLVMANANMPDMDILEFVRKLFKMNTAVILMASGTSVSAAREALAEGASFFLFKPIAVDDLRNVWQFAYTNDMDQNENYEFTNNVAIAEDSQCGNNHNALIEVEVGKEDGAEFENNRDVDEGLIAENGEKKGDEKTKGIMEENEEVERGKGGIIIYDNKNLSWKKRMLEEELGHKISSLPQNCRNIWNSELHLKFTAAISALGDKKARPKLILELMDVPNLTKRQVASHLQKYKSQVRRICEMGDTNISPTVCDSSEMYLNRVLGDPQGSQTSEFGNIRGIPSAGRIQEVLNSLPTTKFTSGNVLPSGGPINFPTNLIEGSSSNNVSVNVKTDAIKLPKGFYKGLENELAAVTFSSHNKKNNNPAAGSAAHLIQRNVSNDQGQLVSHNINPTAGSANLIQRNVSNYQNQLVSDTNPTAGSADLIQRNFSTYQSQLVSDNINPTAGSADLIQRNVSSYPSQLVSDNTNPTAGSADLIQRNVSNDPSQLVIIDNVWNILEKEQEVDEGIKDLEGEANEDDLDRFCAYLEDEIELESSP
ncbi:two-component response regulator ARR12 [Mercurialis annua]|uniref:two-component response regulator ARR12 n=1 Tax=Mercurialis annua TaxID=3986 RepID=UPI00215E1EE3|nr:two-component response regulator ARR12 [Mercurialis annua]